MDLQRSSPDFVELSVHTDSKLFDRHMGTTSIPFGFAMPDANERIAAPIFSGDNPSERQQTGIINVVSYPHNCVWLQ